MGYTHYWKFKPTEKSEKQFKTVIKDCQKILANKGDIVICGGGGEGEPIITEKSIWLNGTSENDLYHETFSFSPTKNLSFDFCKTARKPYDLIVCAILLSLANNMTGFSFSSDGDEEDWKPAFEFYEKIGLKFKGKNKTKIINWLN